MMRGAETWFDEYAKSHQNPTNKLLHWICVPLIVLSVIGLLWSLPVPVTFKEMSPLVNWGTLLMISAMVYYCILSISLALGMVVMLWIMMLIILVLQSLPWALWMSCLAIFILAWIGQFIGHMIEGKRPSFFEDLQFLMIGPFWLLSLLYRRLGIPF